MKVTMIVNGQKLIYEDVEDIKIQKETTKYEKVYLNVYSRKEIPFLKGSWLYVYPQKIDIKLFEKELEGFGNPARLLILEALEEVKKHPDKYGKDFKVRIPKNILPFNNKKYFEIERILNESGESIVNWVQLALVWAQRIQNGESWEVLYNGRSMFSVSKFPKFIIWKDNKIATVGGTEDIYSAFHGKAEQYIYPVFDSMSGENIGKVPMIASYDV